MIRSNCPPERRIAETEIVVQKVLDQQSEFTVFAGAKPLFAFKWAVVESCRTLYVAQSISSHNMCCAETHEPTRRLMLLLAILGLGFNLAAVGLGLAALA